MSKLIYKMMLLILSSTILLFPTLGNAGILTPNEIQPKLSGKALIQALQKGGYTIYMRHTNTDHLRRDARHVDFNDCSTQRVLSLKGKKQAQVIHAAIQALGIKMGKVISSPYCRCKETAKIIFGHYTISTDLGYLIGQSSDTIEERTIALRKMLGTKPKAGENNIFISHTANIKEANGLWPLPEGIMFVFKPEGNSKYTLVGFIKPYQWKKYLPSVA